MSTENTEPKKEKWYHHMWFVIGMLIMAGPFAFPLLWKSPRLSVSLKWMLTILFTAVTVGAVWVSVQTGKAVWKEVESLRSVLY